MITHLAVVMDGNRRWAQQRGLMPWDGHKAGVGALKRVVEFCSMRAIKYVSFYTFSLENFKRSADEQFFLFDLLAHELEASMPMFIEQKARVRFIGDREKFPDRVKNVCELVESSTRDFSTIYLNFLFCYGGRQEIIDGVKSLAKALQDGRLQVNDIHEDLFSKMLWTQDIPDPELIIRTGGAHRLSNFLLYQAAYSEIDFIDCLWPDITEQHLGEALQRFEQARRNFGK